MQNKLHRLLVILQTLPYAPRKVATTDIQRFLSATGHDISLRSVQRDLEHLSDVFAIVSDNARPAGWSWSKDAKVMGVPALDPHSSLVLQLAKKHLEHLLPVATVEHLAPQFRQAAETLDLHGNGLRKWQNKVRVLPRGVTQIPPKIDATIQSVIYESLLKEKKVKVFYRPRLEKPKFYEVNPLGLIVRDRLTYLICECNNNLRQLLLHRMISAEMLDESSKYPDDFDLDTFILKGEMTFPMGNEIHIKLILNKYAARQILDSPLSVDQRITKSTGSNDDVTIEATLQDSMELRWWLLSFGDEAEILEPPHLRDWFKQISINVANYYNR